MKASDSLSLFMCTNYWKPQFNHVDNKHISATQYNRTNKSFLEDALFLCSTDQQPL